MNMIGNSDVSSVGNGAIIPIPTTPGAPTNFEIDIAKATADQVLFTWSAP